MSEPKRKPKYLQILQILLQEISDLEPGSRITGVTALAQRFGVARATAERVLNEMARKGYVRQVPGSGTYVADRRVRKIGLLSFGMHGEQQGFYHSVGQAVARRLEEQGHSVELLNRDNDHGPAIERVQGMGADAFATLGIMNAPYLEELAAMGRPLVAVDYRPMSLRVDSVTVASMRAGYLATRALLMAGCQRLCYTGYIRRTGEEEADATAQRVGFERAHIEAGLDIPSERIVRTPYGGQVDAMRPLLTASNRPDGILCFDDVIAQSMRTLAGEVGLNVPNDVAIMACGSMGRSMSSFLVDAGEMGRVAGQLLSERLSWPELPARDYEIWPDYYDGGTIPSVASEYIRSVLKTPIEPIHAHPAQGR